MLLVIPILGRLNIMRTRVVIISGVNIAWKKKSENGKIEEGTGFIV